MTPRRRDSGENLVAGERGVLLRPAGRRDVWDVEHDEVRLGSVFRPPGTDAWSAVPDGSSRPLGRTFRTKEEAGGALRKGS
jgi:hypothetical protein